MTTFRVFVVSPHSREVAQSGLISLEEARDALATEIETAEKLEAFAFNLPASLRAAYRAQPGEPIFFGGLRLTIETEA